MEMEHGLADTVGRLSEADRQGRAVRVFVRAAPANDAGTVGRTVGYRLDERGRLLVLCIAEGENVVVDMREIVRVEMV